MKIKKGFKFEWNGKYWKVLRVTSQEIFAECLDLDPNVYPAIERFKQNENGEIVKTGIKRSKKQLSKS